MKALKARFLRLLILGMSVSPALMWAQPESETDTTPASAGIGAKVTGQIVYQSYAIKNLLDSIMQAHPELSVQDALSFSILLGIISETDVQLHRYGTFKTEPDPAKPGRMMKIFATDTAWNKVTRSMFDVLDEKLNATVQDSNPFSVLDSRTMAKMIAVVRKDGIAGLVKKLRAELGIAEPKQDTRGKKGKTDNQPALTSEDAPISEELFQEPITPAWSEAYTAERKGKTYSPKEFKAKIAEFLKPLTEIDTEARTVQQKADNTNTFSKLLMTFPYAKDQKERSTKAGAHTIADYYSALLGRKFEPEYYTAEELEAIGKDLTGKSSGSSSDDQEPAQKLQDISAYLAHFMAGDLAFLQAPYGTYTSPNWEKNFSYCAEATIRSIMNALLFNPTTGKLDIGMLPPALQDSMRKNSPQFVSFIEENPDPAATNYYGKTLERWLTLVSGLDDVLYKHGKGENAYEMSASAGPKNLITSLEHVFGLRPAPTKAPEGTTSQQQDNSIEESPASADNPTISAEEKSFESFALLFRVENEDGKVIRSASFVPRQKGFAMEVMSDGKPLIQAAVDSEVGVTHAAFRMLGNNILDLLNNERFRTALSDAWLHFNQDLYTMIFKPSTLNVAGDEGAPTPLIQAIKQGWGSIMTEMLKGGADPDFKGSYGSTPLSQAISLNDTYAIRQLVDHGATVTYKILLQACGKGNLSLVQEFLSRLSVVQSDYTSMLLSAARSKSVPLIEFLLSQKAHVNGIDQGGRTPLLEAVSSESFDVAELLVERGAHVNAVDIEGSTALSLALSQATSDEQRRLSFVRFLLDHGAILTGSVANSALLDSVKLGKFDLAQFIIQHLTQYPRELLTTILKSKKLHNPEKIKLLTQLLERDSSFPLGVLEQAQQLVQSNITVEDEDWENDDWHFVGNLLEKAQQEQLAREEAFGLPISAQEEKCITECVAEAA